MEKPRSASPAPSRKSPILSRERIGWTGDAVPVGKKEPPVEEPTITFDREGDQVKSIEVVCVCGRHIRMDCVF